MGTFTTSKQFRLGANLTGIWWLSGASIDLDLRNGRYYDSGLATLRQPLAGVTDYLSCSRASDGYAKTSGDTWTKFSPNVLRITDLGLLVEPSRTNVVLWNRDLTNGVWTASNITPLKDQTGIDGGANSASSLLATAPNGTILQSITLASSARLQSVFVKRLVGSGVINMTMDNGATWTAIPVTSGWTQLSIPAQTLANPTVGFQIVTNGDKIAVDSVQNEDSSFGGAFISSPIFTTTVAVARATDVVTCLGNLDAKFLEASVSVVFDIVPLPPTVASLNVFGQLGSPQNPRLFLNGAIGENRFCNFQNQDFTNFDISAPSGHGWATDAISPMAKLGVSWTRTGGRSGVLNGSTVVTDALTYTPTSTTTLGSDGTNPLGSYFKRLTIWNSRLADATLQGLTAP